MITPSLTTLRRLYSHVLPVMLAALLLAVLHTGMLVADPSPEGTYDLEDGDTETSITVESSNVTGDGSIKEGNFKITVNRESGKKVYNMKWQLTDGSGSHVDYVYAEREEDLPKNAESYARGNGSAPGKAIFFILVDPELKGGDPIKSGQKAGTVAIFGKPLVLIKR